MKYIYNHDDTDNTDDDDDDDDDSDNTDSNSNNNRVQFINNIEIMHKYTINNV